MEGVGGSFDPDLGREGPGALGTFFAATFAARCCSCIALRCLLCSALLIVGCGLGLCELEASPFGAWEEEGEFVQSDEMLEESV